jgi:hypothetical protein
MKASQQARLKLRCPISLGREPRITIPEGWFELVYDLCAQIEDVAQAVNKKPRQRMFLPRIAVIEVNHGRLHCEVINRNKDIAHIVRKAQFRSVQRCMFCGEQGHQFRHSGGLVSCCARHRTEHSL